MTIILSGIQVFMTFICILVIERVGRRKLLIWGSSGMCLSAFSVAISRIYSNPQREWLYYVTVVAAILYLIFYCMSLGPISWVLVTELFCSDSRGKANTIASCANWSANFIITLTFPFIEDAIKSYSFLIYGFILIFITFFIIVFVPETKNRPIEEIVNCFETSLVVYPKRKQAISFNS